MGLRVLGTKRLRLVYCAFLVPLIATAEGCGVDLGDRPVVPNEVSPIASVLLGIVPPGELLRNASFGDEDRCCHAADYAAELPSQRVTVQGTQLVYVPTWDLGGDPDPEDLAHAMYLFVLADYSGEPELTLHWSVPPLDWQCCFLGLGNRSHNRWDWFNDEDLSDGVLTLDALAPYLDGEGQLLMVLLMTGMDSCTLSWLRWGANVAPVAALEADPLNGSAPLVASFSATASYDRDGALTEFEWDFDGDGEFNEPGPEEDARSNPMAYFTYSEGGNFTPGVCVTDNDGATDTASVEISVAASMRGDWWMYGRNPQHTRRSPFAGPDTNNVKWTFATNWFVHSSPAIASDGTIYVGAYDDGFYAINPDGTQKWYYPLPGDGFTASPAIGNDGTVYVGGHDRQLYAFNPDGSVRWTYPVDGALGSSPTIAPDGTVYVGCADSNVYAVNADGSLKWSYATQDLVRSSPALDLAGTIYVGSRDNRLYALRPDGSQKWSYPTGAGVLSSPAIGEDGTIYVGSDDYNLYAINPDGTLKWSFATLGLVRSSPGLAQDGTIYVGSYDNQLYAINPDGSLKWKLDLLAWQSSASPAIGGDGVLYIGSSNHNFYAINPNGTIKWSYDVGDQITVSAAAIGPDGTVYIGDMGWNEDSRLFAFGPSD